jgi:hypothetical protein
MPVRIRGALAPALLLSLLLAAPEASAKQIGFARQVDKGTISTVTSNDAEGREQKLRSGYPRWPAAIAVPPDRQPGGGELPQAPRRTVVDAYVRPMGGTITVTVERKKAACPS